MQSKSKATLDVTNLERCHYFIESAKYAISQDMSKMVIPGELDFRGVVDSLLSQLTLYSSILKTIDPVIVSELEYQRIDELKPILQICELISVERPELAFQAGRLYERMLYSGQNLFDFTY